MSLQRLLGDADDARPAAHGIQAITGSECQAAVPGNGRGSSKRFPAVAADARPAVPGIRPITRLEY